MRDLSDMIDEKEVAQLLGDLVAIPSINPAFQAEGGEDAWYGEAAMASKLLSIFNAWGIEAEMDEVEPHRPNVIARVKGTSGGPSMLWEAHTDTVQVTGMAAPFTPLIKDGKLYGRGAVDDKASLVAFMLALRFLSQNPPPGDVTLVAAVDEEYNFRGIVHHLERKVEHYDLGIAGEPTDLRIVRACKGCLRWIVEVEGISAHSSKPHEGVSAIEGAYILLETYKKHVATHAPSHELLGVSTLVCTGLTAGEGPNTVPSRAQLRFDYRYLPSEDSAIIWQKFKQLAQELENQSPARYRVLPPFVDSSAMDVGQTSPIVRLMAKVCESQGIDGSPIGVPFGSDSTKMVDTGHIPTIVFGPGSIEQAHAKDEYVVLDEVKKAAQMLILAAQWACDSGDR